jgi:phage-related protein
MSDLKKFPAVFYKTDLGNEPVREWLRSLNKKDRTAIGTDIRTVEFGWPIGMPLCKHLGNGLHEIRIPLNNRIARVLFCVVDEQIVLLHGFIKKTQKIPKEDKDLALKRKKNIRI